MLDKFYILLGEKPLAMLDALKAGDSGNWKEPISHELHMENIAKNVNATFLASKKK